MRDKGKKKINQGVEQRITEGESYEESVEGKVMLMMIVMVMMMIIRRRRRRIINGNSYESD